MNRSYKISYKTYYNNRLKEVSFHGQTTYPLYVQLTYLRKTIFFKSSMFELFSLSRYAIEHFKKEPKGPSIAFVTEKEKALLDFVVEKCREDFSLERFKSAYQYYSRDLILATEDALRAFIVVFMVTKKASSFGKALVVGSLKYVLYDILNESKAILSPSVYQEMIDNLSKAPPYMVLYAFMKYFKRWPDQVITVMEWESEETRAAFSRYMMEHHPEKDREYAANEVDQWVKRFIINKMSQKLQ